MDWKPGMTLKNSNGDVDPSSLGYQFTIQTTTQLAKKAIEQKFYEIAPADYVPVAMGTGAYMEDIKTPRTYDLTGDFETGITNVGAGPARIAEVDVAMDSVTSKIATWVMGYRYTIIELEKALASMNWNVVQSKTMALKKRWDLGIQKLAFLGLKSNATDFPGLLTHSEVTVDTTTITSNISAMDAADFQTLVANIMFVYANNANFTAMPDVFTMPMTDYLGMAAAASPDFPMVSKMTYLLNAFKEITGNANFKILPLAYADKARNAGFVDAGGENRYALYRKSDDTMLLTIPVQFNPLAPNTGNNFQWEGVAVGQFTGLTLFRPREVIYFDHS